MTSPVSMPAGHKMVAGDFDAYENLTGVWLAYATAWTTFGAAPVLGNGTLVSRYMQAGKLISLSIKLTIGSTTNPQVGQFWRFTAPVIAATDAVLVVGLEDNSAGLRWSGAATVNAGGFGIDRIFAVDGSAGVQGGSPFAWATSDIFWLNGVYEAA